MEGAVSERCKAFAAAHRSDEDRHAYISASRRVSSVIAKAKAEAWQTTCSSVSPKSIYIKLKVCLSVCLSAIEIKLETFRYKQTYESYITFSREAKYGILISIRIVYGGLRAYIYTTYIKIWLFNVKI